MIFAPPHVASPVLPFPTMTLRLGFAGNRDLVDSSTTIKRALARIFDVVDQSLVGGKTTEESSSGGTTHSASGHLAAAATPLVRLITGLAEGADRLACDEFLSKKEPSTRREMAAILPFDRTSYRESRDPSHQSTFDRLIKACHYVVELDGHYAPGTQHQAKRARGYRAQSRILLRQSDLLIAVADPAAPERPGGTLETIRSGLEFGVPVLLVEIPSARVRWLDPAEDPANLWLEAESAVDASADASDRTNVSGWETSLRAFIGSLAAPAADRPAKRSHGSKAPHGHQGVLAEYFTRANIPPRTPDGRVRHGWRSSIWLAFSRLFAVRTSAPPQASVDVISSTRVAMYRQRARDLSEYYTSLYRGAFLTNYLLAACAVTLAAACLVLLGEQHTSAAKEIAKTIQLGAQAIDVPLSTDTGTSASHEGGATPGTTDATSANTKATGVSQEINQHEATSSPARSHDTARATSHASEQSTSHGLERTILVLTGIKLLIVLAIFANTHQANHAGWSERGVDYRYLAERLRALQYLPLVGSYQPPAPTPPQFATRAMRQSDVDWLFRAMVRNLSPADHDSSSNAAQPLTFVIDPLNALQSIEAGWIGGQAAYHERNATLLHRIAEVTEWLGKTLNWIVIVVVSIDISILLSSALPGVSLALLHDLHAYAPWLVFLAAVLPAVVASLNGIRFQSECERLSDRSRVVARLLQNHAEEAADLRRRMEHARTKPESDPGAWILPTLTLAERCAHDLIEEVGEWSVLYAKEITEP